MSASENVSPKSLGALRLARAPHAAHLLPCSAPCVVLLPLPIVSQNLLNKSNFSFYDYLCLAPYLVGLRSILELPLGLRIVFVHVWMVLLGQLVVGLLYFGRGRIAPHP